MKHFKMRTLFIALTLVLSFACAVHAETVMNYDANAALQYAQAHCEEKTEPGAAKADCIEFARTCVQKGGVPQDTARVFKNGTGYTVDAYMNYMLENGYAELKPLTTEPFITYGGDTYYYVNQAVNAGKVAPGDIIIYKCTNSNCKRPYYHASICAPADDSGLYAGYYRNYAHNTSVNNKPLLKIQCFSCKNGVESVELYALHITSAANGYENYSKTTAAKVKCTAYNQLKVTWNQVDDATGYYVFLKTSSKGFWEKVADVNGTSFVYTVPKDYYGADQYFKVTPYKAAGDRINVGKASGEVFAYTVPAAPKKVTLKQVKDRDVKVTWDKVPGATVYKVEYQPIGSKKWSFLYRGSKLSATRKGLTAEKKYTFRVTTFTSSKAYQGERPSNKYASSDIYTFKMLKAPAVKRVNAKNVKVTWKNISGETGYQISQSASKTKDGTIKTVKGQNAKSVKIAAKKGKKFYYKVRAYKTVKGKKVFGSWSAVKYF
ncbi:MAG: fibronectin type III domain-containing protein [Firmicutes bacterium]|nr:fibronectin type III domain-containing protein [Bacillota bacterium]